MTRYHFALATQEDDKALRERMAQDVMEGPISVSFRRSPSYFAGSALQGRQNQVITCKDSKTNKLIGLGTRASLHTYINAEPKLTGYLCDLRGDATARGGTLLARGYRYLQELHEANPIPLYYSMILDGNESVLKLLSSGRASLPSYRSVGKFTTPAILLSGKRRHTVSACTHIRAAKPDEVDTILNYVNTSNQRFQFAPVLARDDFNNGRLAGLSLQDVYLAWQDNELVGVSACWDQHAIRQIHVEKYSTKLKLIKPYLNALSKISSYKSLPAVGGSLACLYLSLVAIKDDNASIFTDLLEHIYEARRHGPWQMMFAGFHQQHPLSCVLDKFRRIDAAGQLFVVYWPDGKSAYDALDSRIAHIEIGAL